MAPPLPEPPFILQEFCFCCGGLFDNKDLLRDHLHRTHSLPCPELDTGHRCWLCDIYIHNRDPIEGSGPFPRPVQQPRAVPQAAQSVRCPTGGKAFPAACGPAQAPGKDERLVKLPMPRNSAGVRSSGPAATAPSVKAPSVDAPSASAAPATGPTTTAQPAIAAPASAPLPAAPLINRPPWDQNVQNALEAGVRQLSAEQISTLRDLLSQHCDLSQYRDANDRTQLGKLPIEVRWMMFQYLRVVAADSSGRNSGDHRCLQRGVQVPVQGTQQQGTAGNVPALATDDARSSQDLQQSVATSSPLPATDIARQTASTPRAATGRTTPLSDSEKIELLQAVRGLSIEQKGVMVHLVRSRYDVRPYLDESGSMALGRLPLEVLWMMLEHIRALRGSQRGSSPNEQQAQMVPAMSPSRFEPPNPASQAPSAGADGLFSPRTAIADDGSWQTGTRNGMPNASTFASVRQRSNSLSEPRVPNPRVRQEGPAVRYELPPMAPAKEEEFRKMREGWKNSPKSGMAQPAATSQTPSPSLGSPSEFRPTTRAPNSASSMTQPAPPAGGSVRPVPSMSSDQRSSGIFPGILNMQEVMQRQAGKQILRLNAERRATALGFTGNEGAHPGPASSPVQRMLSGQVPRQEPDVKPAMLRTNAGVTSSQIAGNRYTLGQEQARLQQPSSAPASTQGRSMALDPALLAGTPPITQPGSFQRVPGFQMNGQHMQSFPPAQNVPGAGLQSGSPEPLPAASGPSGVKRSSEEMDDDLAKRPRTG